MADNFIPAWRFPQPRNTRSFQFGREEHSGEYILPPGYAFDDDGGILDLKKNVQDMLAFRDDDHNIENLKNNYSRRPSIRDKFVVRPYEDGVGGEVFIKDGNPNLGIEAFKPHLNS